MGLAVRVIPTLLAKGTRLVKGRRFSADRVVGHVQQAARVHQARGVDELCILDVGATPAGRGPNFAAIEALTQDCFMPLTVGGGVRSVADVERLLHSGADKVAICTGNFPKAELLMRCAARFGAQAMVGVVDSKRYDETSWGGPMPWAPGACAVTDCGMAPIPRYLDDGAMVAMGPVPWAQLLELSGAGEILLTSVDREGTMEGYDLELIHAVSHAVDIPVIAHGGCSSYQDMHEAIKAGASAVAAGALFQFTDATPRGAAEYLYMQGVEVRL